MLNHDKQHQRSATALVAFTAVMVESPCQNWRFNDAAGGPARSFDLRRSIHRAPSTGEERFHADVVAERECRCQEPKPIAVRPVASRYPSDGWGLVVVLFLGFLVGCRRRRSRPECWVPDRRCCSAHDPSPDLAVLGAVKHPQKLFDLVCLCNLIRISTPRRRHRSRLL